MRRTLEAEILDSLAPDHPAALHNRRDLRLTNQLMGNHRWMVRTARRLIRPGERALEIGAGTGELGRQLNAAGVATDALDLWPEPTGWPTGCAWHRADLREFAGYAAYDVVLGNLIFHQFPEKELAVLGRLLTPTARVIIACEPVRRRFSQALFAAGAALLGANYVSRHDARVSIAAGFTGDELPGALGLDRPDWTWECQTTALGAYRMVAVNRSQPN